MKNWYKLLCGLLLAIQVVSAQTKNGKTFTIIPLGVKGGLDESNLSAYLLKPTGGTQYICLDGGTVRAGLQQAITHHVFPGRASDVLKSQVRAYFISHPHLDHVEGMLQNAPDDSAKALYGLPFCLNIIQDKYFNWKSWGNFADAGDPPALGKFRYMPMDSGVATPIADLDLEVSAYPLRHSAPGQSTAFLVKHQSSYLLYLGDTGPDALEGGNNLRQLWEAVSPILKARQLKGIMIETSFPNEQSDHALYGHLTPHWLMTELAVLDSLAGPGSLKGLPVLITHIKPVGNNEARIKVQLAKGNALGVKLLFPQQAQVITL
ncbi:3',5'-cyclic-nucleotide phosphodiesterase [Chitinophaga costaii]|uniref:3',5'-cyclic-nucleotide phosphodiesterase n=1 Tax=Chitinophaga costaii TaxID=1335309 RepID=A0A1C3YX58_9BACT|nr:3',5'-cyclic-nucleotide phosphodiesterase [Chitinophaga costaii]PUZ30136.1 3',5'-cyclic-nucleotide phosphodiesterase [Chitinophaga costaii]SCB74633.1 3',5'-cyclic-nucleotide phosphodiesterase [Chitinophaga costaii]